MNTKLNKKIIIIELHIYHLPINYPEVYIQKQYILINYRIIIKTTKYFIIITI